MLPQMIVFRAAMTRKGELAKPVPASTPASSTNR